MARKGVAIVIGSKGKVLRFNMNALAALEDATGASLLDMKPSKFGFKQQRAFVWAALLHEEPKLTLEQAGDLLDEVMDSPTEYNEVLEATLRAFAMAFPESKKSEDVTDPNAKSATGGETASS